MARKADEKDLGQSIQPSTDGDGHAAPQVGAAPAVMRRFDIAQLLVTDSGAWSPTLLATVNAARQAGIRVSADPVPPVVDGVTLRLAADGRTWLVDAGGAALAIIPPDTGWSGYPTGVQSAIFTDGGPQAWAPPDRGDLAVIQVASQSRDGLPAHAFIRDLAPATVLRTDRLGTVELIAAGSRFTSP